MTMDVPVFAQATVDQTDEFSRKLSVYARGQLGKIDYRVVLSDPFPTTSNGQPAPALSPNATFSQVGHHKQFQGFFIFNFFDKESHTTPYMTGTYLGKKKVFNLEAGFISQKRATWTRETAASDTAFHSMNLLSYRNLREIGLKLGIRSTNGVNYFAKRTYGDTSSYGPTINGMQGAPVIAWTGKDAAQSLNVIRI